MRIFTALMVSKYSKPLLCDKDALHTIWHMLEFFGNTILFVLCGVFGYVACKKAPRQEPWRHVNWRL